MSPDLRPDLRGGWCFVLLAMLYLTIDVCNFKRWALPFLVIGSNAILAYMLDPPLDRLTDAAAQQLLGQYSECYAELLGSGVELALIGSILIFLYRRGKYLRV